MSRFTFFTSLLAAVIVLIVVQLVLRDYFLPASFQASVAGPQTTEQDQEDYLATEQSAVKQSVTDEELPEIQDTVNEYESVTTDDFSALTPAGIFLTENLLGKVGFDTVGSENGSIKIFQLFDMKSFAPVGMVSYSARDGKNTVGLFAEWEYADEISAQQAMDVLQNKSKVYVDLTVNSTNAYGDASFFLNHKSKPDEAFLIIRMRNFLYSFAYLKLYHPQVKALISLLYTDILDRTPYGG